MGKYQPLMTYLQSQHLSEVPMRFEEVVKIIGFALPASAYNHRPWWANEDRGHVHAKAWLDAGYQTEQVDMEGKKLVFRRVRPAVTGMAEEPREFRSSEDKPLRRHPAIGVLKGTFTIEPGWDLTKPAMDPDELAEWEASLDRKADLIEQGMTGKKR